MEILEVLQKIPNMVGVKYAEHIGYNEENTQSKIPTAGIVVLSKNGYEKSLKEYNAKVAENDKIKARNLSNGGAREQLNVIPRYVKIELVQGAVYKCKFITSDGSEYTGNFHQNDIPAELLPKEATKAPVKEPVKVAPDTTIG